MFNAPASHYLLCLVMVSQAMSGCTDRGIAVGEGGRRFVSWCAPEAPPLQAFFKDLSWDDHVKNIMSKTTSDLDFSEESSTFYHFKIG